MKKLRDIIPKLCNNVRKAENYAIFSENYVMWGKYCELVEAAVGRHIGHAGFFVRCTGYPNENSLKDSA